MSQFERWKTFASVMSQFRDKEHYSSLWANFINDFRVAPGDFKKVDAFIQKNCRGYGFLNAPAVSHSLRDASELHFGHVVHGIDSLWRRFLSAAKSKKLGRQFDWRTYKVYSFFKKKGIRIDEFLMPISKGGRIRLSYNSLKIAYFAHKVFSNCTFDQGSRKIFLEIGAGAGNFQIITAFRFTELTYYVVDLPEMLLISSFETIKHVPNARIFMPNDVEEGILEQPLQGAKKFIFLTPSQIERIPEKTIDLALNIESFAEMPQHVAKNYVHFFYRALKNGGYMFTANRESRVLSDRGAFTCYWKLPYSEKDEIILWEYCPMRQFLMSEMSPNINRLAKIPD